MTSAETAPAAPLVHRMVLAGSHCARLGEGRDSNGPRKVAAGNPYRPGKARATRFHAAAAGLRGTNTARRPARGMPL